MNKGLLLLVGLLMLGFPTVSLGADYASFQQDSVKAYGFYKKALSLTSKPDTQEKSIATMEQFQASWKVLAKKYKQDIPAPFAALPNYAELIERPLAVGQQALSELKEGKIKVAHGTLEEIRYLLWNMRIKAGLTTLNDKINDFHEVMEIVLEKMHADKSAENMRKVAKRYGPWMEIKWEELATVEVFSADRIAFEAALKDGRSAIANLRSLMATGDAKVAQGAGKKVKKAYKAVFFLDSVS